MFSFANPWFLLLLLAVPPLVWWWLRRRRGALRFPEVSLLANLPVGHGLIARWTGASLRAAALVLLIVALSGPRWPDLKTRMTTEGIAIGMLVDVSGSMAETDFDWQGEPISRLDAVKRVFRLFVSGGDGPDGKTLEGRPDDQIGLVTFATRPESLCPLTLSHSTLLKMLDAEQARTVPGESETNMSDALILAVHRLQSAGARRKIVVLLSDGEHNVPQPRSEWTPRQAAQIAANLGVPIYTIDAGGETSTEREPGSANDSAASRAEGIRTLQEIAHITAGKSFRARDTQTLLEVCREIDVLEREPIQSFQYRRYHEWFPWFGLASLVLFVGAFVVERTIWQRLP